MTAEQAPVPQETSTPVSVEHPFVFMGGLGYDQARNREVGGAIIALTGHAEVISLPDLKTKGAKIGHFVHHYPDGTENELSGKAVRKGLHDDASVRYSRLHEQRAEELITAIEHAGSKPVDAVFQSVDVSTGILAMHRRPELFKKVVLMDPSSIIKLPPKWQYLREEWRNGNLRNMMRRKKESVDVPRFEKSATLHEKRQRFQRSTTGGNLNASYVSYQATMLHEAARAEHAPSVSIIASRFDHAYTPERLLKALISLDDIQGFFVTNARHGLGGKQTKLEQLVGVLNDTEARTASMLQKLHFFDGVAGDYRQKIIDIVKGREDK